jgi:hypothetical protein
MKSVAEQKAIHIALPCLKATVPHRYVLRHLNLPRLPLLAVMPLASAYPAHRELARILVFSAANHAQIRAR